MATKCKQFPTEITITVEEKGTENEFLCAHDAKATTFQHDQKVATYRLVEVRTCKVTTVVE